MTLRFKSELIEVTIQLIQFPKECVRDTEKESQREIISQDELSPSDIRSQSDHGNLRVGNCGAEGYRTIAPCNTRLRETKQPSHVWFNKVPHRQTQMVN